MILKRYYFVDTIRRAKCIGADLLIKAKEDFSLLLNVDA